MRGKCWTLEDEIILEADLADEYLFLNSYNETEEKYNDFCDTVCEEFCIFG